MIIIGGGMAGLSTGTYAQRCGFQSTIFESHTRPGGVCTSWRRGPYLMDAGIRMIIGTAPPNPFYYFLREVGVIPSVTFSSMPQFQCVEDEEGRRVHFYRNLDRLSNHLLEVAPEDGDRIREFLDILESFSRFHPNLDAPPERLGLKSGYKSLAALGPVARHFIKYWRKPLGGWLRSFKSPAIRNAFSQIYTIKDFPLLAMFTSMGWFIGGYVGKPASGSRDIIKAVADTYARLGGNLRCGQRVEKILVRSGKAEGVRLEDGSEHRADIVISAADGYTTLFNMLGEEYVDKTISGYYRTMPVFKPLVMVQFGAKYDFKQQPESLHFPIRREFSIFDRVVRSISLHHTGDNELFAPVGHSTVRIGIETDYEPWAELAGRRGRYRREKERIADELLDRLEERFPGIARSVAVRDVATPVTTVRYTGNRKGAYEGWQPTTRTFGMRIKRNLGGLRNFYMTGQWVEPGGGIPGVLFNARTTLQIICGDRGIKFEPGP